MDSNSLYRDNQTLVKLVNQLREDNQKLKDENDSIKDEFSETIDQKEKAYKKVIGERNAYKEKYQSYVDNNKSITELVEINKKLNSDNHLLVQENIELSQECEKIKEISQLQHKINKLTKEKDEQTLEHASIFEQVSLLQDELSKQKLKANNASMECNLFKSKFEEQKNLLKDRENEIEKLRKKADTSKLQSELIVYKQQMSNKTIAVNNLMIELKSANNSIEQYKKKIKELEQREPEIDQSMENKYKELQKEFESYKEMEGEGVKYILIAQDLVSQVQALQNRLYERNERINELLIISGSYKERYEEKKEDFI